MSNLIKEELKAAKEKTIKLIPETDLVELSRDNVAIVEAMIQTDSSYQKGFDKDAKPKGKYKGSTAYWMNELKKVLVDKESVTDDDYKKIIKGAVEAVDRENSTHLNSDGVGREEITERIYEVDKTDLLNYLKNPDEFGLDLIEIISKETDVQDKKHKPRKNVSFASKFCHYACFYLFEGEEAQDNYSITDGVLKKVLPKYIKQYEIKKYDLENYADYKAAVDEIIRRSEGNISRNGFDHLIWYYYKGRV